MDGLPSWYHGTLTQPNIIQALKQTVFSHLENDAEATLEEVMSVNDIALVFEGEVEEFMTEWAE